MINAKGHAFVDGTCENCGEPDPDAGNEGVVSTLAIFELGKNGAAEHKESTTAVTTYTETVYNYTLSITGGNKMYTSCNDAKGNGCIKLGTGSVVGGFSFTVPADVTEVVIYVAKYKANTTKITVNGASYTISGSSNDGAYDAITVDTTSTKTVTLTTVSGSYRAMVNAIEFKGINNCKHENIEDVAANPATCTQSGNTAGTKCADCGAIMTGCEEIKATGHNWVDATCQAPKTCSVCEATDGVVADHNYVDGACTVCGAEEPSETEEVIVTFNLGANGSASHNDGNSKSTHTETVDGYKLSITSGTNMYTGARDAKGNSCIKLGASSKAGGFSFTVPAEVTEVTIYVAKYKSNTTKLKINNTTYTLTKNSNDGAYDVIVVDTSVTKTVTVTTVSGGYRAMVNTIEFVIPGKN